MSFFHNRGFVGDGPPPRPPEALATLAASAATAAMTAAGTTEKAPPPNQGKLKGLGKMFAHSFLSKENFFSNIVTHHQTDVREEGGGEV